MEWKPTGKVFTSVGHRWLPTRWTFTINGTKCPMTRITSNPIVPPKETNQTPIITPNPEVKVVQIVLCYLDPGCSKHMTGKRSQLINFVEKFLGTVRIGNDHIEKIIGYGDYQNGNVIVSQAPLYLWAEAFATACYTQNRSLIRKHHNKISYELLHDRKPDLKYLYVFGALCYTTNDSEDLGKLKPKADIGIFIGYAPLKKAYRIYNRRTRTHAESPFTTPFVPPTKNDWDLLFQPMFDEYFNPPPSVVSPAHVTSAPIHVDPTGSPILTFIDQATPSASTSSTIQETQSPVTSKGVVEPLQPSQFVDDPFLNILTSELSSQESSSNVQPTNPPFEHINKWTKIHLLENVIGNPSRPVST
ncbi:retrovirus-related pol polyprotein from transposon TNT 1-94 [Tanacetum coccineum]